jgi:glucose-1-phosphate thymidylyltransferase
LKVIIPLAGLGTRLRPHTLTKPKPLVNVAGKPVLAHILDSLLPLSVEEVFFITGYLGEQIETFVRTRYSLPSRFIRQEQQLGQAHAIGLTKGMVTGDVLIIFVDTIFEADLARLQGICSDGVVYVHQVEDPRRFGVAVLRDGYIARLVEKPAEPVSNLAVIGVYYFKDATHLFEAIDELIARDIRTGGEYYLADAIQILIDRGSRIEAWPVEVWEDCGKLETLLQTNRFLLTRTGGNRSELPGSIVRPPVFIAPSATVEASIVGPYVTIADNAVVRFSIVRDSIINEGALLEEAMLSGSVIGSNAVVRGNFTRLNVGDASEISLKGE